MEKRVQSYLRHVRSRESRPAATALFRQICRTHRPDLDRCPCEASPPERCTHRLTKPLHQQVARSARASRSHSHSSAARQASACLPSDAVFRGVVGHPLPSCHRSCTSRLGGRGLTRRIRSSWRLAESNPRNHYWRGWPSAQPVNSRHLLVSQFTEDSVERKCAELCMSCHVLPWLLSVPLKDALRYHCPHGRQRARPE